MLAPLLLSVKVGVWAPSIANCLANSSKTNFVVSSAELLWTVGRDASWGNIPHAVV